MQTVCSGDDGPTGDVDRRCGDRAGPVGGHEGRDVADVLSVAPRPSRVGATNDSTSASRPSKSAGNESITPPVSSDTTRMPWRPSSLASCLRSASTAVEGDLEPADACSHGSGPLTAEHQDDPGALADHVATGGACGQVDRAHGVVDRLLEVGELHLDQGRALHVARRDEVHRDVEGSVVAHQLVGVCVDGALVEGVDLRSCRGAAVLADLPGACSSFASVRPARCTVAPSRAKAARPHRRSCPHRRRSLRSCLPASACSLLVHPSSIGNLPSGRLRHRTLIGHRAIVGALRGGRRWSAGIGAGGGGSPLVRGRGRRSRRAGVGRHRG